MWQKIGGGETDTILKWDRMVGGVLPYFRLRDFSTTLIEEVCFGVVLGSEDLVGVVVGNIPLLRKLRRNLLGEVVLAGVDGVWIEAGLIVGVGVGAKKACCK